MSIHTRCRARRFLAATFALVFAQATFAHIRIYPMESTAGAREKYTMRVPNEKQVNSIRVEGEFPGGSRSLRL